MRIFFGVLASLVLVAGCEKRIEKAYAPPPVEVAVVQRQDMPVELRTIGTVEPIASVQLKSKVQGEITKVLFADGVYVKAGQALFAIYPRPFEVALQKAQADLTQAFTETQNAQAQVDRYTKLTTQGVSSKEQFAQYLTTASSQKSILAARQADVDQAKLSLEWATVRAPIGGRAGAALLKTGNIVQANTDILTIINQTQPIYVSFSLPETQLAAVRKWMSQSEVSVTASDPDQAKALGRGRLDFVDNAVDRQSGMITMKATFPNENESLWPGQFVDVTVTLTSQAGATVLPTAAVLEGQNGAQVFVINNGVAKLQPVEVERVVDDWTVIRSGVQPGDTVIVSGQLRVQNGGKVSVSDSAPRVP